MSASFVPAVDCVHVELLHRNNNSNTRMDVGLDYLAGSPPSLYADLLNIAETALVVWAANIMPLLSDATLLLEARATLLTTETSPSAIATDGSTYGSIGVPHLAPQLAACLRWYTERRGPSGRGRIFLGCLSESQVTTAGIFEPAFVSAIETAFATYQANFVASLSSYGFDPVVLSKFHVVTPGGPAVPRTTAIISPIATGPACDQVIRTQRRRAPRG